MNRALAQAHRPAPRTDSRRLRVIAGDLACVLDSLAGLDDHDLGRVVAALRARRASGLRRVCGVVGCPPGPY